MSSVVATRPLALGFLGTGWIGRHRMQAIMETGLVGTVAIADPSPDCAAEAAALAEGAKIVPSAEALLDQPLDGLVIATPSAMHADQAIAALERGMAVFCQKPLGRNAGEARAVVDAARAEDRLLMVDFSYRLSAAAQALADLVRSGELGQVFAIDLTFHNAYGPDKPWFYDKAQAGGGCAMDLGVHLIDLALWLTGFPALEDVSARLYAGGRPLPEGAVEDYALATLALAGGTTARIACSWRLNAGVDAVIEVHVHGTQGGASLCNVAGSFYDFALHRHRGTASELLVGPPDAWGARTAAAFARRLAEDRRFDSAAEELFAVSAALDAIYAAARP